MQKEQKEQRGWGPYPILIIAAVVLAFFVGWSIGELKVNDVHKSERLFLNMQLQEMSRKLGYALEGGVVDSVNWKDTSDAISELGTERLPGFDEGVDTEQREAMRDLLDRTAYLVYTVRFDGQQDDPATQETVAELQQLYLTYFVGLEVSADPFQDLIARMEAQD